MALEPSGFKIGFYVVKVYEYPSLGVVLNMAEPKKQPQKKESSKSEATSIIRIVGKDVDGSLNIERALDEVRGIGSSMAHALAFAIEKKLNIGADTQIGSLSEAQMSSINDLVKNPAAAGIPPYMLNRRKDAETGLDVHTTGSDLAFAVRQDITREVNMRSWRGFRHQYGQRVRGQHTRSTGRTGVTVGVTKKAQKEAEAAAKAASSGKPGAPAGGGEKKAAAPAAAPAK